MTFTYVSSYLLIVLPALKKTNKEKYKGDINKLFSTTSQEFDYFSSVLKANSQWDTLYEIMDETTSNEDKEKFFKNFFTEDSLKESRLDYIAIYDNKQNEIINYYFPETNIKDIVSFKGKKFFLSNQPNGRNRVKMVSGYIDINKKAYMFFSHIILHNDGTGKSAGSLLFIKEIDNDYIFDLEMKNNLLLQLYIPNENDEQLIQKILSFKENSDFYSNKIKDHKRVYYIPYMKRQ